MIIYCITNKINGKQYVGQTIRTPKERFDEHCRRDTTYIGKAIAKYGRENFKIEVVDSSLLIDDLNEKETYWIKRCNTLKPNGYNLCYGGNNTFGYKHKLESRLKMSKTKKLKKSALGEKNHFYGKNHTEETREKMKEAWASGRRKLTEEHKRKMIAARQTRKVRNLTTGEVFDSILEAANKYDIKPTHITRVCRGRRKSTGGFEWEYVEKKAS